MGAHKKKRFRIIIILLLFIIYFFLAARPIPREVILSPNWISSLTENTVAETFEGASLPVIAGGTPTGVTPTSFILGSRFGYVDSKGQFIVNRIMANNIYRGRNIWTEYEDEPSRIDIKNLSEETIISIENAGGYPVLLDDRVFILGSEQNALSEIDENGDLLWIYEFGAPLTCIDVAAGLVLTGSLDGIIEIFNSSGERIFYFEPGGSRYEVILGCALSRDGSRIGIISGIDQQRFLLLERFGSTGGDYKVIFHEFLNTGFRRPVRILFIDEDRRIVFERTGGIGCYNIRTRQGIFIPLDGEIYTIEESGDQGFLFLITSHGIIDKKLVGIRFPQDRLFNFNPGFTNANAIFLKAHFKSEDVFLGRDGSKLIVGGGSTLISYNLEEK